MATNLMDKGFYQAPIGIEEEGSSLEIEIENPDAVTLSDGSIEITLQPETDVNDEFNANLAEDMGEGQLNELSGELIELVEADIMSRKEWADTFVKGLEVLGMKYEERTEPWNGACGVFSTILTEAAIRFQAESIMETFPAAGPVKTEIIGAIDKFKEDAAERVRDDMNYKLTEEMPEYRPEHERLLYSLGLAGSAFKKIYYDPSLERQVSIFVTAEDLIVPYGASNLNTAERVTHVMRKTKNEMRKLQVSGFYRDIELGEPVFIQTDIEKHKADQQGYKVSDDDRFQILEIHADLVIEGDEDVDEDGDPTGIALPYVVTIERGTGEVLAIRRNWNPEDNKKLKRQHFVDYIYIPGFGFYGFGLIHLVGGFAKSATSILRQLVDSGTLSNLPGGFKSKDLRVKGDDTPIAPGEWRDVDVTGMTIKDSIVPLPYKEPSQTLFNLLNTIVEEGRKFASVADLKVGDMSNQAPVGTTLAILERTLKVMSAVQARVHAAMKHEFKLIAAIVRDYTPESYSYEVDAPKKAKRDDYDIVDIIPVSDPNASTMAQRVVQYQAALQLAASAPGIYDLPQLHRQMLEVLGIKNVAKIIPIEDEQKPMNPVSENMAALSGKPIKAFLYQDHEAHLKVHMSAMQDPKMQQIIGQNPQAQVIQAAMMAHINEHVAFQYRIEIEKMLGVPLPPPDEQLPEDIEVELSRAVAIAAEKLLQKDQAEAAQKQAQQAMQDPVVQQQNRELDIREAEVMRKKAKDEAELELRAADLTAKDQRERERIAAQERIAGAQIGAKAADLDKSIDSKQRIEGMKIGADLGTKGLSSQ